MNRSRKLAMAGAVPVLVLASTMSVPASAAPAASWHPVTNYCSPSGDLCYGIQKKGPAIRFRMDSFVDFGPVNFCVRKAGRHRTFVCHQRPLKLGAHELYTAKIRWQGNYPTAGSAKRIVRFMKGSPKLSFRP